MTSPSTGHHLGAFEQLVLLALVRLRDHAYGISLQEEIQTSIGRDVSLSMVYKAVWRLEAKGFIVGRLSEPIAKRGGRRKKLYAITADGRAALQTSLRAVQRLSRGVDKALAGRWA
jgi:DNA-binding PadR family transcriptional regulator